MSSNLDLVIFSKNVSVAGKEAQAWVDVDNPVLVTFSIDEDETCTRKDKR